MWELNREILFRWATRFERVVERLRQLFAGLSRRGPEFDPTSVHVRFVVDNMALGQVFLRIIRVSLVDIIPPMLHARLNLHVALVGRTNGDSPGTFQKQSFFGNQRALDRKVHSLFVCVLHSVKRPFIHKLTCILFEPVACLTRKDTSTILQGTALYLQDSQLHKHIKVLISNLLQTESILEQNVRIRLVC